MAKTMQQQDHDAWELGYGVSSSVANQNHNSAELKAMYEALARRKAAEEAAAAGEEPEEKADVEPIPIDESRQTGYWTCNCTRL